MNGNKAFDTKKLADKLSLLWNEQKMHLLVELGTTEPGKLAVHNLEKQTKGSITYTKLALKTWNYVCLVLKGATAEFKSARCLRVFLQNIPQRSGMKQRGWPCHPWIRSSNKLRGNMWYLIETKGLAGAYITTCLKATSDLLEEKVSILLEAA